MSGFVVFDVLVGLGCLGCVGVLGVWVVVPFEVALFVWFVCLQSVVGEWFEVDHGCLLISLISVWSWYCVVVACRWCAWFMAFWIRMCAGCVCSCCSCLCRSALMKSDTICREFSLCSLCLVCCVRLW